MKTEKREYDPVKRREYYLRTRVLKGRNRSAKTKVVPKSNWVDVLNAGVKKHTDRSHIDSFQKDYDWVQERDLIKEYLQTTKELTPEQKKQFKEFLKVAEEIIKLETNDSNFDQKKIDELKVRMSNLIFDFMNAKHIKEVRSKEAAATKDIAGRFKRGGSQIEDRRRNPTKKVF